MKIEKSKLFKRFIFLLVLFLPLSILANPSLDKEPAEIEISSSVDKNKLSEDDILTLTIKIQGNIESAPKIKLPAIEENFRLVASSQSQNLSLKEGKSSLSINFEYKLAPRKAGEFIIGPVEAIYKTKAYKTEEISITVTLSSRPKPPPKEEAPQEPYQEEGTIL